MSATSPGSGLWRERVTARRQVAARPGIDRAVDHGQRLVSACLDLIVERGDTGFPMRDVAKAAGVSLTTAYARFRGKDELLLAALEDSARKNLARLSEEREKAPDAQARLRTSVIGALGWAADTESPQELLVLRAEAVRLARAFPEEMRAVSRILVDDLADELRRAAALGIADPIDIKSDADILVSLWSSRLMCLWNEGRLADTDQDVEYVLEFAARLLRITET
ncbi:TetR/AcrR family transcriptional regulator [Yinghuangia sp. YIM S10712]|uniref:TetR/AcrR family transcriptional regulator n=1 Tax=Yinghuangia sp. YIM S10712 TaxID=3436930 RepID=UPI003F5394D9